MKTRTRTVAAACVAALVGSLAPTTLAAPQEHLEFLAHSADFNADGYINGADLTTLLLAFSAPCNACPEDLNSDGVITGADLSLLLLAWASDSGAIAMPHASGDQRRYDTRVAEIVGVAPSRLRAGGTRVWVQRPGRAALEGYDIDLSPTAFMTVLIYLQ